MIFKNLCLSQSIRSGLCVFFTTPCSRVLTKRTDVVSEIQKPCQSSALVCVCVCVCVYVRVISVYPSFHTDSKSIWQGLAVICWGPSGRCSGTLVLYVRYWTGQKIALQCDNLKTSRFPLSSDHLTILLFVRTPHLRHWELAEGRMWRDWGWGVVWMTPQ